MVGECRERKRTLHWKKECFIRYKHTREEKELEYHRMKEAKIGGGGGVSVTSNCRESRKMFWENENTYLSVFKWQN